MNEQTRAEAPVVSPPILWNARGDLACANHAPQPGSDTWVSGHWRAMTEADVEAFEDANEQRPACEMCAAIERRNVRRARGDVWRAVSTEYGWEIRDQNDLLITVVPDALHVREADAQMIADATIVRVRQTGGVWGAGTVLPF